MHIAILGRQPALGVAELERLYGSDLVSWFSDHTATVNHPDFDFSRLGGSLKAGVVTLELPGGNWRRISAAIIEHYRTKWQATEHKITLGISAYGLDVDARDVQGTGIALKKQLRSHDVSVRLIPNQETRLSTATSHHNKLGSNPHRIELLVVRGSSGRIVVAESVGVQNITALAARDQARPRTDAFVGMLPPKLARMMVNLSVGIDRRALTAQEQRVAARGAAPTFDKISDFSKEGAYTPTGPAFSDQSTNSEGIRDDGSGANDNRLPTILDPFCGTGVVLQEALLLGLATYGTDLSEKMVAYSRENIQWLTSKYHLEPTSTIELGDAMKYKWRSPIDAVVCETYLGQPFSAPPSPAKLNEVRGNCDHIISEFLKNLHGQIKPGTPLCIAIPAWNDGTSHFTHLPLIHQLQKLGYQRIELKHVRNEQLLYYREGQIVARELLLLTRV